MTQSTLSEFFIDFCFIRETPDPSTDSIPLMREEVEKQLHQVLGECGSWFLTIRTESNLDIITAETKGIAPWAHVEDVERDMERKADSYFWDWLHSYRIRIIPKEDAGSCPWKPYRF